MAKILNKFNVNCILFNSNIGVRLFPKLNRAYNAERDNQSFKRTKLIKRIFSTALFGGTFITAVLLKKHRQQKMRATFEGCVLLPGDENYAKPKMFYQYKGFVLPDFVIKEKTEIEEFEVDSNDIWVVSFPKTGTTWVQEIVYLIGTNLNFEQAQQEGIETRFPYLEFIYPGVKSVAKMLPPRFIKSHLPFSLLPNQIHTKKPKVICVMRNPKDVTVSFYHFVQMLTPTNYKGTFEEFAETLMKDKVMYGPLWKHYLEFWEHRNDENVLLVNYEDLHKDLGASIDRIASFMGKTLSTEEVNKIKEHCSFRKMSVNPNVNYKYWDDLGIRNINSQPFMRKGIVGDWKNYFNEDLNRKMDVWIEDNLHSNGIEFIYDLNDESK